MLQNLAIGSLVILATAAFVVDDTQAFTTDEHRLLGDSVYYSVMRDCAVIFDESTATPGDEDELWGVPRFISNGNTFGHLCAQYAVDDMAADRFHTQGTTVLEQLQQLSKHRIAVEWHRASGSGSDGPHATSTTPLGEPRRLRTQNVVSGYLLHHLIALRVADATAATGLTEHQSMLLALEWEAIAQGFLADAFSSGHILVPRSGLLSRWQRRNHIEAHHYHRSQGVYVINSRGDAWQTFGDQLMHWYAPTYRAVLEACRYSLREVMVVFYQSSGRDMPVALRAWLDSISNGISARKLVASWLSDKDGHDYYATIRMPTLQLIPMPVAATWSVRTSDQDEHGIRRRRHFPQLRNEGMHDPDLTDIDTEFLYSRTAVPDWLIARPFRSDPPADPETLIKIDPDWASVRWIQNRYAPPSYKGALIHAGGQITFGHGDGRTGGLVGIGYGFWDDLILLRDISLTASILGSARGRGQALLLASVGGGFPLGSGWLRTLRLDGGPAVGLHSEYNDVGRMLAIGLDSRTFALRFTNAGITWRLKYQWLHLDRLLHGPSLELILH